MSLAQYGAQQVRKYNSTIGWHGNQDGDTVPLAFELDVASALAVLYETQLLKSADNVSTGETPGHGP